MAPIHPLCLAEFCRDRGLWHVTLPQRDSSKWRGAEHQLSLIYFTLGDGALVEIDASTVDWKVTVSDGDTGTVLWDRWYDVFAHALEAGGDFSLQSLRSLQQFVDIMLEADSGSSLAPLEFDW